MRAMFLPSSRGVSYPPYLAALSSAESFSRKRNSSGVKSSSLRKLRLRRLNDMTLLGSWSGWGWGWDSGDRVGCRGVGSVAQDELDELFDDEQAGCDGDAD